MIEFYCQYWILWADGKKNFWSPRCSSPVYFFWGALFHIALPRPGGIWCKLKLAILIHFSFFLGPYIFSFFVFPDSPDDTSGSKDIDDVESSVMNKALKTNVLKLLKIFPYKSGSCSSSGRLTHTDSSDFSLKIHSKLDILKQTWLAVPSTEFSDGASVDWSSYKKIFPNLRFGKNVMPRVFRKEFGDPPFDLPFDYGDLRTKRFFEGEPWLKDSKISLPDCFDQDSTHTTLQLNKIALNEGLIKRSLQSAHGLFDLNSDFFVRLEELEKTDPMTVDWNTEISFMKDLIFTNILALRRQILCTSSSVMVNKQLAREIILPRFEGKPQLKDALRYSDFGTPDLFGPLNAKMQANADKYFTHDCKEWRLLSRKRKASAYSAAPAPKRSAKMSAWSTPVASSAPVSTRVESQKKTGERVFHIAQAKKGKRGGRGRGQKGR